MTKRINQCDVFVLLWALYYLQGLLYPYGIINQFIQFVMILMGLISLGHYLIQGAGQKAINATIILIVMYCIYGVQIIITGDGIDWTADSTYLKNSLNSLLPIAFFYMQTKQGRLTSQRIRVYLLFILSIIIVFYFFMEQRLLFDLDRDETTNNSSYMFISAIPLIYFFYNKPLLQYILLAIIIVFTLMGMKRGAIAIGACCMMIFLYSGIKEGSTRKKIFTVILSVAIVFGIFYYVGYLIQSSDYFLSRIQSTMEGNTSGRDIIYSKIWNTIKYEHDLLNILFGHGANSTVRYAGNFAHQDWLETACNNGFIGIIILVIFFVCIGHTVLISRKYLQPHLYYCFVTLFFICFTKTIFSMSIQNFDMYQSMLLGYLTYWTSSFKSRAGYHRRLNIG